LAKLAEAQSAKAGVPTIFALPLAALPLRLQCKSRDQSLAES
jgi:hypothetical protein